MAKKRRRNSKKQKYNESVLIFVGLVTLALFSVKDSMSNLTVWLYVIGVLMLFVFSISLEISFLKKLRGRQEQDRRFRSFRNVSATDDMDDFEFERFIAFLYENQGYRTAVTQRSNDRGIDIRMSRNDKKVLVQVKHYKINNKVGRPELQRFVGAYLHLADEGYLVTSSSFNENALEYAKDIPTLKLVAREDIGEMIENLPDNGWQKDWLVPK